MKDANDKIKFARRVVEWMRDGNRHGFVTDFPHQFIVIKTSHDNLYGRVENYRVSFVSERTIVNSIYEQLILAEDAMMAHSHNGEFEGYGVSHNMVKTVLFPHWESVSEAISLSDIKTIGFLPRDRHDDESLEELFLNMDESPDEGDYCFEHFEWQKNTLACPLEDQSCPPMFAEILSRCSNADAVAMWVGSLFHPNSDRSQYLWLYGDGRNSKGSFARVLKKVFGRAFRSETPPNDGDRFWTSGLVNVRLATFFDCNKVGFPRTGLFKSLTGGDPIRIERKGKDSYTAELETKFLFLSNDKPMLSGQLADTRRAIYCEFAETDIDPDPLYEDKLWREREQFFRYCYRRYERQVEQKNLALIPTDPEQMDVLIQDIETEYSAIVEQFFLVGDQVESHLTGEGLLIALEAIGKSKSDKKFGNNLWIKDLKKYFQRNGVSVIRPRIGDKRPTIYLNLGLKMDAQFYFGTARGQFFVNNGELKRHGHLTIS